MDFASMMSGLEGLAAPHAAEIGSHLGMSAEQVTEVMGHLGGQASAGVTDPHAAAATTAQATGIDPAMIQNVIGALTHGGGIDGLVSTVQNNPGMLAGIMSMAKGMMGGARP